MKANFEIDGTIAITAGEAYLDLHNDYDFVGFEHRPPARTARFEWTRSSGSWVAEGLPPHLVLSFDRVSNLVVRKRDDEMPFTEDDCVAEISFVPPELADDFESVCPGYRSDAEHLAIWFQSGAVVKIWAESVTHH